MLRERDPNEKDNAVEVPLTSWVVFVQGPGNESNI